MKTGVMKDEEIWCRLNDRHVQQVRKILAKLDVLHLNLKFRRFKNPYALMNYVVDMVTDDWFWSEKVPEYIYQKRESSSPRTTRYWIQLELFEIIFKASILREHQHRLVGVLITMTTPGKQLMQGLGDGPCVKTYVNV